MNRYGRRYCEYQQDGCEGDIVCKTCRGEIKSVRPHHVEYYCPFSHKETSFKDTRVFPENYHYLSIEEKMLVINARDNTQGE